MNGVNDNRLDPDVLARAKQRGWDDYNKDVVVGDNPYRESDARFWAWLEGWAGAGMDALAW